MQKVLIPAVAALGTASVTVPVVLLNKGNSSNNEKPDVILVLNSAKDIQSQYTNIDCLKNNFGNIDWTNSEQTNQRANQNQLLSWTSTKGCLIVEHSKQTYGEKWKGEFKLVWAVAGDTSGFILVVTAKTKNGKITADSAAYITKKETDKWTIEQGTTNTAQEATDTNALAKFLPKAGSAISEFSENKDTFWNFNPDMNKICSSQECSENNVKSNKQSMTWYLKSESTHTQAWGWCDNFSNWFTKLFGSWNDISNKFQALFGTWSKQP